MGKFKDDWIRAILGLIPLGFVIGIAMTVMIFIQFIHPVWLMIMISILVVVGEFYLFFQIMRWWLVPTYVKYMENPE